MGLARDPGKYESREHRKRWECNPGRVVRPNFVERTWLRPGRWFVATEGINKRASGRNCFRFRLSDGDNGYIGRVFRDRFINDAVISYDVP